jgi:hypothetical protein
LAFRSPIEILGSFYFVNIILPVNNVLVHNTKYSQAQEFMVHVFADGIYVLCMVHNGLLMAVWGGTTTRGHDLNHFGSGSHLVSNENSSRYAKAFSAQDIYLQCFAVETTSRYSNLSLTIT